MRKLKLTWQELCLILQKQDNNKGLAQNETIKEITLMNPKEILIRAEQKEMNDDKVSREN